jgi:hypothetical protein
MLRMLIKSTPLPKESARASQQGVKAEKEAFFSRILLHSK